jgi:hypothetical protein
MRITHIAAAIGLAALVSSLAIASQPEVKLDDLGPGDGYGSDFPLHLLMLDPYAASEMQITLPTGYATLDVDADPFAG